MILKTLTLVNFKTHKNTTIEFDNVTSFIGTSDSGKTNIIRALKILLFNEDFPASQIRYGCSESTITIELVNGNKVSRTRNTKGQTVTITENGVTTSYTGKNDVNSLVQKITGFNKLLLDQNDSPENLNFIGVHDGPYLLNAGSATVQKKISSLLGISKLEDLKGIIQKEKKATVKEEAEVQRKLLSTVAELGLLETRLDVANNLFKEIEHIQKQRNQFQQASENINNFIKQFGTSYILTANLSSLLHELVKIKELFRFKIGLLSQVKGVNDLPKLKVINIKGLLNTCFVYQNNLKVLKLIKEYSDLKPTNNLEDLKNTLNNLKAKQKKLLKQRGVCPTCGTSTK